MAGAGGCRDSSPGQKFSSILDLKLGGLGVGETTEEEVMGDGGREGQGEAGQ